MDLFILAAKTAYNIFVSWLKRMIGQNEAGLLGSFPDFNYGEIMEVVQESIIIPSCITSLQTFCSGPINSGDNVL